MKNYKTKYSKILTKDFLIKEYIKSRKSSVQIAKKTKTNKTVVINYLIKYNIPRRTRTECQVGILKPNKYGDILTKEFLIKNYIKNKKDALQIADKIDCSIGSVYYWLKQYNISIRSRSEAKQLKSKLKDITEKFLIKEYIINKKPVCQIAKALNCEPTSVYNYLRKYKVKIRSPKEAQIIKYNKHSIVKHHIYLKENSDEVLKLTRSQHRRLHQKAYYYIYEIYGKKGIDKYIKWFTKYFK